MSSVSGYNFSPRNINGVITTEGTNKAFVLLSKANEKFAGRIYSSLYEKYDLGTAKDKFMSVENNMVE